MYKNYPTLSGQVYFDPQKSQYYTQTSPYTITGGYDPTNLIRTYIGNPTQQQQSVSPVNDLIAQSLAAKANAPTMAQLFPTMGGMYNNANGLLGGFTGAGQYGAGRFLGNNVMGNPSLTSTAMNVK